MDIDRLRKFATNLRDEFDGHTHAIGVDVLRILDAFEAMEKMGFCLHCSFDEDADPPQSYTVQLLDGAEMATDERPLIALLKAVDQLEDKTDG